jgi:hypothetical protein
MKVLRITAAVILLYWSCSSVQAGDMIPGESEYIQSNLTLIAKTASRNRNKDYPQCELLQHVPEFDRCWTNRKQIRASGNQSEIEQCAAEIKKWSPTFFFCNDAFDPYLEKVMDQFRSDYRRSVGSTGQAEAPTQIDVNSCVSVRAKARVTPSGGPSCAVDVTNGCSVPVVCQIDISGVTANAVPAQVRQAVHLMPGDEGERGLVGVMNCGSVEQSCKAWKR